MATTINISRNVTIPDKIKIERCRRMPDLGPRILFFSGGTALKRISKHLINYTYNSIHLITPFDSGGSSAHLRNAFGMISVGDLRNRLMALADQSVKGNPTIYRLFKYRFPTDEDRKSLIHRLHTIARGEDPLIVNVKNPMKKLICNNINYFLEKMPDDFDLRGANIGNLILAGGYLKNNNHIDIVLFIFSKLVEVRGVVKPIVDKPMSIVTELNDGTELLGQHRITGKEYPKLKTPIKRIYLTDDKHTREPTPVAIDKAMQKLITTADLICYPMGSFFSSVLVNLIPDGVSTAIMENECPKVYIPNTLPDPEQVGMDLLQTVETLLAYLRKNNTVNTRDLLNYIIIDSSNAQYPFKMNVKAVEKMGIDVIDTRLVTDLSFPYIDPKCIIEVLLSLM